MLQLPHGNYQIVITDDFSYGRGSADNPRSYDLVYDLTFGQFRPSSQHALTLRHDGTELRSCIVLAGGGASGVHQHSATRNGDECLLAVGPFVCSLKVPTLKLLWHAEADTATCFGIHHAAKHRCYISHGELEVARIGYDGELIWSVSGGDIFTNGFTLYEDHVEVIDWNGEKYRIDVATGACVAGEV